MDGPPPPPPPHGSNPKSTAGGGLPAGNYDIFIIPPHSSGGGFLYLPSLQVQTNSFLAGVASTLAAIAVWKMAEPTVKQYFLMISTSVSSGGSGVILLVAIVGFAGWAYGKTQVPGGPAGPGTGPQGGAGGAASGSGYQRAQSPPNAGFPGAGVPPQSTPGGGWHGGQHQQHGAAPPPPPQDHDSWSGSQHDPSGGWEHAREETRKRQEEREQQKKKEEADRQARAKAEKEKWEKMRAREREQREREARERIAKEKLQKEKDAREKEQREREARDAEARAKIEKEIREKLEAEQKAKAAEEAKKKAEADKAAADAAAAKAKADAERSERLKAARERAQKEREVREARQRAELNTPNLDTGRRSTTYGGIGGGERIDPYAGARSPPAPSVTSTQSSPIKVNVSPKKNYEKPSAKSYVGTEDAHSFRPYDTPKRPPKPPSHHSSMFSESSYAPSQSTARTTPPPSQRGPYSTSDPDKIQIKAVFLFNDLFPKPVAQLVSGIGNVTDGLILKIHSEGLFIDDDVRNVPQREWDVKAWTIKLVETGEKSGRYFLRFSQRDANNKKYIFIIEQSESWKVAIGLQRLKKGSQVRSMGNEKLAVAEINRILSAVPPIA